MGRTTPHYVPGWARLIGLDRVLIRRGVDRLLAQSHIARIRNGQIAHHAPAAPLLLDASANPLPHVQVLTQAFQRAKLSASVQNGAAQLVFAAFGSDQDMPELAAALCPGGAFAMVSFQPLDDLASEAKAASLTVTKRRHWGGLAHSIAGFKPIAS